MIPPDAFDNPDYYINRELSWLAFNERVLEEARNAHNPLAERLKFLAITSSNLDEFFMVRMAGLEAQVRAGVRVPDDKTGMPPEVQWEAALARISQFVCEQDHLWNHILLPALREPGIYFASMEQLDAERKAYVSDVFFRLIYPVLTPIAVDAGHPFPLFFNRTLNLAILLKSEHPDSAYRYAFVPVPGMLPRFFRIPDASGRQTYILLEEIIRGHASMLFRGADIIMASAFRITRNADLPLNEEAESDLLEELERELTHRETGEAVRIEVEADMHPALKAFLVQREHISSHAVFSVQPPLDFTFLLKLAREPRLQVYQFLHHDPIVSPELKAEPDIFQVLRQHDLLLYHPYASYEPVVEYIRQAADDPDVVAIKQTLYRVGGESGIVAALAKAAENGKQVTVLVELRARFDEEKNIEWAKMLEKSGCHVIYGLVGIKTHAKMALVVRVEKGRLRRYVHLGTGNYNRNTARLYTDFSLFTANDQMTEDVAVIFNQLSGYLPAPELRYLHVAPWDLEKTFLKELEEVMAHPPGRIIAKMNSLTNKDMIQALYAASAADVEIDLIVRGVCSLRPGIPGVSEHIRVHSIVGRFLEHGRAYYFRSGSRDKVFLSSADWMTRNFEQRVEALFPVLDPMWKSLVVRILETQLADNVKRRELQPDGTYLAIRPRRGEEPLDSQEKMYAIVSAAVRRNVSASS